MNFLLRRQAQGSIDFRKLHFPHQCHVRHECGHVECGQNANACADALFAEHVPRRQGKPKKRKEGPLHAP
eukprot:6178540-Pleurochrysis_carterae.AAC.1